MYKCTNMCIDILIWLMYVWNKCICRSASKWSGTFPAQLAPCDIQLGTLPHFSPLVASDATAKFDEGTREYSRRGDLPNNLSPLLDTEGLEGRNWIKGVHPHWSHMFIFRSRICSHIARATQIRAKHRRLSVNHCCSLIDINYKCV